MRFKPKVKEIQHWEGWGTALKPACEPIVVARKPLSEKNVALMFLSGELVELILMGVGLETRR
jgi:hypothetical protein